MELLKEFKPALIFLGKFLALYFIGNILYGVYIESHGKQPDGITWLVTRQTSWILDLTGYETAIADVPEAAKVSLMQNGDVVLHVYEGCNGLNVMIVFIAFLFAFGGPLKKLAIFLPLGLFIIHLVNLMRVSLLFHLALNNSQQFYYYHKYFFTATLYAVVFALWAVWVIRFNEKRSIDAAE